MPVPRKRSLAERRHRWFYLIASREELVAEMPYLAADLQTLEAVEKEIAELIPLHNHYLARCREITAKISRLAKTGDHVRGRIGASLRGRHGYDALELIKFGFKARRNRPDLEDVEMTSGAGPTVDESTEDKGDVS